MMFTATILAQLGLASLALSQQAAYAQCGGQEYSGGTSCVSGYSCVSVNQYYSQCQAGASAPIPQSTQKDPSTPTATGGSAANGVVYLGRVNPATKELTWPGTGVQFTFEGSSATISLSAVVGTVSFDLVVDGGAPKLISDVSSKSISTGSLSKGKHTVSLIKRSETVIGTATIDQITTDGTFSTTTVPNRRIEVIGDSISVGYGLDGTNPCTNDAVVEDNPKTYVALAAKALNASWSAIAWSGKGITRNLGIGDTSPLMPELWTRYGANDADNSYTFPASAAPQAVVIALGTNDFAYLGYDASGKASPGRPTLSATTYSAAVVSFVKTIKGKYPSASFFLVTSPMLSDYYPTQADAQKTTQQKALKDAAAQLGAGTTYVDWPTQGSDVGCDYHPNAATQFAQGQVLKAAIASALGW